MCASSSTPPERVLWGDAIAVFLSIAEKYSHTSLSLLLLLILDYLFDDLSKSLIDFANTWSNVASMVYCTFSWTFIIPCWIALLCCNLISSGDISRRWKWSMLNALNSGCCFNSVGARESEQRIDVPLFYIYLYCLLCLHLLQLCMHTHYSSLYWSTLIDVNNIIHCRCLTQPCA